MKEWEAHGLPCQIRPGLMGFNGYVQIPKDHPLFGADYYEDLMRLDISVHGGVTYGVDEDGWIGFDTAHSGDVWAPDDLIGVIGAWREALIVQNIYLKYAPGVLPTVQWTMGKLTAEVEHLAEQLADMDNVKRLAQQLRSNGEST